MKLGLKKMRKKEKERNFIENGGRMLEEYISSCDGRVNPIRMYSAEELEKAVDITKPVFITGASYYKGTYLGRTILMKFHELWNPQLCDEIFNEMAVLSQMKHRNVVKLLGCCLETKVPTLVYEFASNGRLSDHVKDLSWEDLLRIAAQVADALTYMHTATGKPIVHRDIKPSNILLDDNYSPKVIELGLSITIPVGETHAETDRVLGSMYYLAPELVLTSQVTEKCDVYSFGQLLLDLLTQTHPGDRILDTVDEAVDLVMSSIKDKLDAGNWSQGKTEQLLAFAVLASRCLKKKGEERPTMKEVVQELRRIIRSSLETRNTTETENVSMEEVQQELTRILRYLYKAMFMTERERHSDVSDLERHSDVSDLERHSDVSDLSDVDVSDLDRHSDVSDLERHSDVSDLSDVDVSDLDRHSDVSDLERHSDVTDLERHSDVSDLARHSDVSDLSDVRYFSARQSM